MIPTKQTVLHDPANGLHGNCLSAVLASLLHLPIEDVPLFATPETWVKDLNAWLRPFGLAYCMVEDFDCHIDAYGIEGLWHEVSGNTSRSKDVTHACVAKDGEFVFDPHPDDTGLTKITCHGFFIALEPWRVLTHNADATGLAPAQGEQMSNEAIPAQGPIDVNASQPTPLLPCPFCGADVTMGKNREGAKIIYFQVECDECGAIAGSGYTTEPAAAKNWNRRANVEVTGAAPKGGAASSDRRERGRP